MTSKDNKKINFAESYEDLQKIVEWFEKGEIDLDEGLKKFEEGLKLVQELKKYLAEVENKVKVIKVKFNQKDDASEESGSLF